MYIPKRWLLPGILSLVLGVMVLANLLSMWNHHDDPAPAPAQLVAAALPAPVVHADTEPAPATTPLCQMSPAEQAAFTQFLIGVDRASHAPPPPPVINTATNSGVIANSQFNDGGFGDIGQQWRNVQVAAPVTNVHTSGNNNTTTVVIGNGNTVGSSTPVSPLSDTTPPTVPAPTSATPTPAAPTLPVSAPAAPTTPSAPTAPAAPTGPSGPAAPSGATTPAVGASAT